MPFISLRRSSYGSAYQFASRALAHIVEQTLAIRSWINALLPVMLHLAHERIQPLGEFAASLRQFARVLREFFLSS